MEKKIFSKSLPQKEPITPKIFISHRSTDKAVAEMIMNFLVCIGVPQNSIFCSSLPGNDVKQKISAEIKEALQNSVINIVILSQDYYQSAYCLNEAGILWYRDDVKLISIALPEITSDNMLGFLNNEYKLRRLDSNTDISGICDAIKDVISLPQLQVEVVTFEINKLIKRYNDFLKTRELKNTSVISPNTVINEITTDDERIILYYILTNKVRKVSKKDITNWLHDNEIFKVNVDNGFDLLSSIENGVLANDTLELGINAFRKYSSNAPTILQQLQSTIAEHQLFQENILMNLLRLNKIPSNVLLFFSYVVDRQIFSFGYRWKSEEQKQDISQWETDQLLSSTLSDNYEGCLEFLIQNDFVYESEWTSYGNPRQYTLYPSLQKMFSNCPKLIFNILQNEKAKNCLEYPF